MTNGFTGMQWMICYGCDRSKNIPCMLMLPTMTWAMNTAKDFYIMQLKDNLNRELSCPLKLSQVNYNPATFQQIVEIITTSHGVAKMEFVENKTDAKLIEDINNRFRNIEIV